MVSVICVKRTPKYGLIIFPFLMTESAIDLTILPGNAKPILLALSSIATLTPMTLPLISSSGPPELPGLIAASVWMTLSSVSVAPDVLVPAVIERDSPDIMPSEIEFWNSARALPMAMADWPNCNLSELANVKYLNPVPSTFNIATSKVESLARTLASYFLPSFVMTVYEAVVSSTTWLLVTI